MENAPRRLATAAEKLRFLPCAKTKSICPGGGDAYPMERTDAVIICAGDARGRDGADQSGSLFGRSMGFSVLVPISPEVATVHIPEPPTPSASLAGRLQVTIRTSGGSSLARVAALHAATFPFGSLRSRRGRRQVHLQDLRQESPAIADLVDNLTCWFASAVASPCFNPNQDRCRPRLRCL